MHTDNDICTTYFWKRLHMLSSESTATITWTIPEGTPDGTYTIWHYGDYKHIAAGVQSFKGKSGNTWSQPSSFKSNAAVHLARPGPIKLLAVTCPMEHCISSQMSAVDVELVLQAPSRWVPQDSTYAGWLQG